MIAECRLCKSAVFMLKKMGLKSEVVDEKGREEGHCGKEMGKKRANAEGSEAQLLLTCVG